VLTLGALASLTVVLTVVALRLIVSPVHCGFYCGPHLAPRLAGAHSFTDTKWGFVVDYDTAQFALHTSDPNADTVDLTALDPRGRQLGEIEFIAMRATATQQAIQSTLQNVFPSSRFSDPKPVGPVSGAEIGLIPGAGTGYLADQRGTSGASANQDGIMILASTHGNVTIVAAMWSLYDQQGDAPFYLLADLWFDSVITNLHFTS